MFNKFKGDSVFKSLNISRTGSLLKENILKFKGITGVLFAAFHQRFPGKDFEDMKKILTPTFGKATDQWRNRNPAGFDGDTFTEMTTPAFLPQNKTDRKKNLNFILFIFFFFFEFA